MISLYYLGTFARQFKDYWLTFLITITKKIRLEILLCYVKVLRKMFFRNFWSRLEQYKHFLAHIKSLQLADYKHKCVCLMRVPKYRHSQFYRRLCIMFR